MNHTGLDERTWALIRGVLRSCPEIRGAVLFGSRAQGGARPGSDVDIALLGIDDPLVAEAVARELDELPLPYQFDVVAFDALEDGPLREHIATRGIPIGADMPEPRPS